MGKITVCCEFSIHYFPVFSDNEHRNGMNRVFFKIIFWKNFFGKFFWVRVMSV